MNNKNIKTLGELKKAAIFQNHQRRNQEKPSYKN